MKNGVDRGRGGGGDFVRHLTSFSKIQETMHCLPKWDMNMIAAEEDVDLLSHEEIGSSLYSWSLSSIYGHDEELSSAIGDHDDDDEMSTAKRRAGHIKGFADDSTYNASYPTSVLIVDKRGQCRKIADFGDNAFIEESQHFCGGPAQASQHVLAPAVTLLARGEDDAQDVITWWNDVKEDTTATESESKHSDDLFYYSSDEENTTRMIDTTLIKC
jgi:hypothetical protein